jgi:hypothetical protein
MLGSAARFFFFARLHREIILPCAHAVFLMLGTDTRKVDGPKARRQSTPTIHLINEFI